MIFNFKKQWELFGSSTCLKFLEIKEGPVTFNQLIAKDKKKSVRSSTETTDVSLNHNAKEKKHLNHVTSCHYQVEATDEINFFHYWCIRDKIEFSVLSTKKLYTFPQKL